MPDTDAGPYWHEKPPGMVTMLGKEYDALVRERDKFKQAFLEGSDKVIELRAELARAERDVLEGAEHDREIMNGQSAEIERYQVELTHRVGWEERCLRVEAALRQILEDPDAKILDSHRDDGWEALGKPNCC